MLLHGTTGIRSIIPAMALLAGLCNQTAIGNDIPGVVVSQHIAPDGTACFALAVKAPVKHTSAARHIIITDTSASQVGTVRETTLTFVDGLLTTLPRTHQVRLYAADVDCEPLSDGFSLVDSEATQISLSALKTRTPLGTTDFEKILQAALSAAEPGTSVLYIGDGFSANRLSQDTLSALIDELNSASVSFHSRLIGPRVATELPCILAGLTGGTVDRISTVSTAANATATAEAIQLASVTATELELDGRKLEVAGQRLPKFRSDRHSVVFADGQFGRHKELNIALADGEVITLSLDGVTPQQSGAEIAHLTNWLQQSNGINAPVCDLEQLAGAGRVFNRNLSQAIQAAKQLTRKGRIREARTAIETAARLDSSNPEVQVILTSLKQPPVAVDEATEIAAPPSDPAATELNPAADSFGGGQGSERDPLDEVAARVKLQTQILVTETNSAIDDANRMAAEDPQYAANMLKSVLETIQASADISEDVRAELERRVVGAIGALQSRLETEALSRKQAAQDQATREAQKRRLEEEDIEEQRLAIQIEKVRGLLDRARHGDANAYEDAEFESRITLDLKPGSGPATQALVMSEASGQLDKLYRLVNLRHDRFLEVLYQVELSHVPFPDEPPIQYPPADVWRALTLVRKPKYESFDLRNEAPVEAWLRRMLDKPVRNLDFPGDTPLREILDTIEAYFTAAYGSGAGEGGTDFKMSFYEDVAELGLEGISSLEEVTISNINFDGMTLKTALKLIFEQTLDDTKAPVPLTYIIQDEVMKVTTVDKAESEDNLVTRVYPIADLAFDPRQSVGGGGGIGGQQGGGQFGGGGGGGQFGGGGGGQFGGGGGFQSIPPELLAPIGQGISTDAVKDLKKKPTLN